MELQWSYLNLFVCFLVHVVSGQNFNPTPMNRRRTETPAVVLPRSFTPRAVREAFTRADDIIETKLVQGRGRSRAAARSMPAARHLAFQASMPRSRTLENVQERFEEATRVLLTEFNLTPEQISYGLGETDLNTMLPDIQLKNCEGMFNVTQCQQDYRYRNLDGTCNNLRHPSWGMAASCFERLVNPQYADGTADKRVARSGNPLPEPRRLSLELHSHFDNPTDYVTHMFMAWGQFIAHDVTLFPQSRGRDNELLDCCPVNRDDPEGCDPILLQRDDPFYRTFNITCLSNVRSAMCSTCSLGPRQQTNQLTSYIDCSHVYGLNRNQSRGLRNNDGTGTLRFANVREAGGELLPSSLRPNEDQCSFQDPNLDCFEAGDQRVNQHPALTSLHVIFLREHNRIARALREINPRWDEETLFQETRRIVIAEMQTITYSHYLPLVLGPERMEWYDLSVCRTDKFTQYDETIQANLVTEFSSAAFRFGHSMINGFFRDTAASDNGNYLRDIFNFPFGLYRGQLDGLIEGLTASPAQKFDRYMVRDVTDHLYQNRGTENGLDLASLNINRGRDHGIPGYTTLVEYCGGPTIRTWRDLDRFFQRGLSARFQNLYETVEDIDLFSGGLAERPNPGAVVGPTFTCILGIQFYHLKYGDRFYFEHGGQVGSFTIDQLREIKKATLGKIVCDNTRINELPENVFLYEGSRNMMESCDSKPSINLNAWRA